ncbi:hypothetical protein EYZ11_007831 [Aspergillus tanneri]|uniref:Uncharacterized protein n=1 Tax=Aspergillus tanneri TaxID=1220188 RepID=A0A4S3JCA6_9EURO|nr:hypothetical protein EYZ11_007831 [Aspergillus tanneri]
MQATWDFSGGSVGRAGSLDGADGIHSRECPEGISPPCDDYEQDAR